MLVLLRIAGGVALLLFGVRYLRKGLDRLFGARLGQWLRRVAARRGLAFLTGIGLTIIAPSSTTMSLLAVQTVQAGQMTARQMLAVMLGANVGLTILVQLVSLNLDHQAPIFIFLGFVLFQYSTTSRAKGIGQIILALGFFFLAMFVIKYTVTSAGMGPESDVAKIIQIAERYPFWIAVLAAATATLLQSATAAIGVVIGLGAVDAANLNLAVPVVIGANIGLALTTLMVGWRQIESRRLGVANLALKLVVAIIGFATMPWLIDWLNGLPGELPRKVANVHTGFNLAQAIIGLPLIGVINLLMERSIRESPGSRSRIFGPKFIHTGPIDSFALATGQAMREIMHMSEIVRSMLGDIWTALKTDDERLARDVSDRDNKVDLLDAEIKRFLTRLVKEDIDQGDPLEQIRQLQYLTELETVGDIVDKNLSDLALKKMRLKARFTPEGERELDDFYKKVVENQILADTVFATRDRRLAEQLVRHKERLNEYEQELRDRHFARLNAGMVQAHETSAIHLDLLTHLKRINSSLSHVAYAVLQNGRRGKSAEDVAFDSPI
ncbi:MAG: Na/Pi cotransporter family protein [Phycisphaerales bacterium]|nr:Na/Pi cotransporter family protein [Phycisphaerales bacterium]MCI0631994.1 Na/Pi cotransporter family protein [Phycisphaerales bacterium]MCI0676951.1 Na/Pi cotransporter family protein [Phycisphaerales bacterium]